VEVTGRLTSPLVRVLQAEDRAVEVRAELINFPIVAGSTAGRCVWTADGLDFTLDRMPGAREAECLLKDGAGYALTHVIAIRRQDANPIRVSDFEAIADTLYDALSFCAGSYVGIGCAAGLDSAGARVWESWEVSRTQFWSNPLSWLPPAKPATNRGFSLPQQPLEVVMPQIMGLARHEPWYRNGIVRSLVASLCEGMRDGSVEIRLATLLTGLELLAWCRLVLDSDKANDHKADDKEFNRDFWRQLERLLKADEIPLPVPDALPDLAHYAKGIPEAHGISGSGPKVIVEVRNRLVHPPTRKTEGP
jgi:hypothetical protein